MVPILSANTQEVLVHAPHHRPHELYLGSGAKAQSLPRIPSQWARVHREKRARIEDENAGWPGVRCWGPRGSWNNSPSKPLRPLVGLGDRVSGPHSYGSLALNKQFRSVADWLPNAFVFLPFFFLVCDLSPFPWLYFFFCIPHDGGYRTLVELASTKVGPGEVGQGKFPRYIRWYHGMILLIVLGVIVALWLYKKWPCFFWEMHCWSMEGQNDIMSRRCFKIFQQRKGGDSWTEYDKFNNCWTWMAGI